MEIKDLNNKNMKKLYKTYFLQESIETSLFCIQSYSKNVWNLKRFRNFIENRWKHKGSWLRWIR